MSLWNRYKRVGITKKYVQQYKYNLYSIQPFHVLQNIANFEKLGDENETSPIFFKLAMPVLGNRLLAMFFSTSPKIIKLAIKNLKKTSPKVPLPIFSTMSDG